LERDVTTPAEDKEIAAFVAWAVKKYRQHAYRHTSADGGEWAAWQAGRASVPEPNEEDLRSFLRTVIALGVGIEVDAARLGWSYDARSARLDDAAVERARELLARLKTPKVSSVHVRIRAHHAECAAQAAEMERDELRAAQSKWVAAARAVLSAHDADMKQLGEMMMQSGVRSITVPGSWAGIDAMGELRRLVDAAAAAPKEG
jgi:murein L,D-transpeptidase YcbB/YkuD